MSKSKSADRTARVQEKKRLYNRDVRSKTRTILKNARQSVASGDVEQAQSSVANAIVTLDRAGKKGVFHRNKVARLKSRLTRHVNALSSTSEEK
ncbi:MAG: 30S ribosomal protein S20 [Dehalococcoidia bacterium]|nr:30S ribosomal protein S20 [Dehalococcoidia bacterium]